MLDRLASTSVAAWYTRLIEREDWARAALLPYAGRVVRIEAGPLAVSLAVRADGALAAADGSPAVTITLAPQALTASMFDPAALRRRLRIDGDVEFAQALTDVLERLRPDPAEELSRFLGDAPAERLVRSFTGALHDLGDAAARIARQGADYFVAENPLLLGRREWDAFCKELEVLGARVAAAEARLDAAAADKGTRG